MRFVVLAYGSVPVPGGTTLGSVDTATSVQDRVLRDGTYDGPASSLRGVHVVEASDLDAVVDLLPATGTFEVRPAGVP